MNSLKLDSSFEQQDIKKEPLNEAQLNELYELSGSYEALFNKRAQLYKKRQLNNQQLSEQDYKALLLEHYTFLKRPVFVINKEIFIGNSKATVEALSKRVNEK